MTTQLTLKDVTKSHAGRTLLDGISLTVRPGEHVAVAGDNGSGSPLLMLDEPTNHLSPTLVGELEQALDAYRGALVSHDRALGLRFTGTRLRMHEGVLEPALEAPGPGPEQQPTKRQRAEPEQPQQPPRGREEPKAPTTPTALGKRGERA